MHLLLTLLGFSVAMVPLSQGAMSVLGLGSSGGGSGGANLVGTSFSLDTSPRITKVHGAGLSVDLDVLELHTGGGTVKYTPTHTEYVLFDLLYS